MKRKSRKFNQMRRTASIQEILYADTEIARMKAHISEERAVELEAASAGMIPDQKLSFWYRETAEQ